MGCKPQTWFSLLCLLSIRKLGEASDNVITKKNHQTNHTYYLQEKPSFKFECGNYKTLQIIGRGFQKEVWLGRPSLKSNDFDKNLYFGVKGRVTLPQRLSQFDDGFLEARFKQASRAEQYWLRKLNDTHVLHHYGSCGSMYGVELVIAPSFLFARPLPWCARINMAISVLGLLELMARNRLMHCDFKPDQIGFDIHGTAKIVDLDTLQPFKGNKYIGKRSCKYQNTSDLKHYKDHRELRPCCDDCMKHSQPQTACYCTKNGQCPGLSSDVTLVSVVCTMVFSELFYEGWADASNFADLPVRVDVLVKRCATDDTPLSSVLAFFHEAVNRYNVNKCTEDTKEETRMQLQLAFEARVNEAKARCEKRYC
eukprot:m.345919 g.345919  ORF g.345919 m.345919 type:complete len:367 (-) comp27556_c0_seq1:22-1122(-)